MICMLTFGIVLLNCYDVAIKWINFAFYLRQFRVWQHEFHLLPVRHPRLVNQSYLMVVSFILSWQLVHLNELTCFALFIMLALYELCEVLTPCGPLKLLMEDIHKPNAPAMTKLLYKANLTVARPPLGEPPKA